MGLTPAYSFPIILFVVCSGTDPRCWWWNWKGQLMYLCVCRWTVPMKLRGEVCRRWESTGYQGKQLCNVSWFVFAILSFCVGHDTFCSLAGIVGKMCASLGSVRTENNNIFLWVHLSQIVWNQFKVPQGWNLWSLLPMGATYCANFHLLFIFCAHKSRIRSMFIHL